MENYVTHRTVINSRISHFSWNGIEVEIVLQLRQLFDGILTSAVDPGGSIAYHNLFSRTKAVI